mmetsp:Transcript_129302/g.361907  ORF Transcript_129302/g.361907 Transcript_129302/m.361907 type:complete len:331 (+) Transcript_129302:629-1621(+)
MNDASNWAALDGDADEDGDVVQVAADELDCAVQWVNPQASIRKRQGLREIFRDFELHRQRRHFLQSGDRLLRWRRLRLVLLPDDADAGKHGTQARHHRVLRTRIGDGQHLRRLHGLRVTRVAIGLLVVCTQVAVELNLADDAARPPRQVGASGQEHRQVEARLLVLVAGRHGSPGGSDRSPLVRRQRVAGCQVGARRGSRRRPGAGADPRPRAARGEGGGGGGGGGGGANLGSGADDGSPKKGRGRRTRGKRDGRTASGEFDRGEPGPNAPTVEEIEKFIDERNEARRANNFPEADRIRELLHKRGVALMDEPGGRGRGAEVTTWRYWRD